MRHVLMSGGDSVRSVLFISAGVVVGSNRSATSSSCTVNFFAVVWTSLLIPIAEVAFFEESAAGITPVKGKEREIEKADYQLQLIAMTNRISKVLLNNRCPKLLIHVRIWV